MTVTKNLSKILQETVIYCGFPYDDYRIIGEKEAYYAVQRGLHDMGLKSAWVVASRWAGETSAFLIEGPYTRALPSGCTACSHKVTKHTTCNFLEAEEFATPYAEAVFGFTSAFYDLPVILPDGTMGKMSAPDYWGKVWISRTDEQWPTVPPHIVAAIDFIAGLTAAHPLQ